MFGKQNTAKLEQQRSDNFMNYIFVRNYMKKNHLLNVLLVLVFRCFLISQKIISLQKKFKINTEKIF